MNAYLATYNCMLSPEGKILLVNDSAVAITGLSRDDFLDKSIWNTPWLNYDKNVQENVKIEILACASGKTVDREMKVKVIHGAFIFIRFILHPIKDEQGNVVYLIAEGQDITERKEHEEKLKQSRLEAEAATNSKSQFLSTMSHEIRTPMNGVIGVAQLLEDTPLNDEQRDYLDTITSSGNSLISIINDILDFSKLDANKVKLESIAFDFEQLAQECLELVAGNSKGKRLEFILDYHPDCPRFYMGDPSRIRQILLNLLGNAVKFTAEGYIRCGVSTVTTDAAEEQLRLEIQDTGIGLKPEAITHLFDEFTQADSTTTRKFGGTGLGLAITKKLVEVMGGELNVNSVYGEGSTFWMQSAFKTAETLPPLKTASLDGVKVLFVDASKESRRVFARMFKHMGAEVTVLSESSQVSDALQDALQQNRPFKLAVLDHNMPDKSGMELGVDIRNDARFNELKMLILTSFGAKGDATLFAQAGFDGYLNKLSRYETFKGILSAMLEHKRANPIITQHNINDVKRLAVATTQTFNASVLLAEDILLNQLIAKKFISNFGIRVDIANDGQEALDACAKNTYDLIFMDCRMPVIDGYAATKLIRQREKENKQPPMPIIALTANASSDDRVLCEEAGMNDVVTKPYKRDDIASCLQQWLPHLIDK